jgi:hypothetical protein
MGSVFLLFVGSTKHTQKPSVYHSSGNALFFYSLYFQKNNSNIQLTNQRSIQTCFFIVCVSISVWHSIQRRILKFFFISFDHHRLISLKWQHRRFSPTTIITWEGKDKTKCFSYFELLWSDMFHSCLSAIAIGKWSASVSRNKVQRLLLLQRCFIQIMFSSLECTKGSIQWQCSAPNEAGGTEREYTILRWMEVSLGSNCSLLLSPCSSKSHDVCLLLRWLTLFPLRPRVSATIDQEKELLISRERPSIILQTREPLLLFWSTVSIAV